MGPVLPLHTSYQPAWQAFAESSVLLCDSYQMIWTNNLTPFRNFQQLSAFPWILRLQHLDLEGNPPHQLFSQDCFLLWKRELYQLVFPMLQWMSTLLH